MEEEKKKEGEVMKNVTVEEMRGYQHFAHALEMHGIMLNNKMLKVENEMLIVINSYVIEYGNKMNIALLLAYGEKAVFWINLEVDAEFKFNEMKYRFTNAWTGEHFKILKECFNLRVHNINLAYEQNKVLTENETICGHEEINAIQYMEEVVAYAKIFLQEKNL